MQNDDGYVIVRGETPPDDLLAAAETEIASGKCGEKCRDLMEYGFKVCFISGIFSQRLILAASRGQLVSTILRLLL